MRGESETLKTEKPIRSFILLVDKLVCVFGSKRMREMDSLPASPLLLSRSVNFLKKLTFITCLMTAAMHNSACRRQQ